MIFFTTNSPIKLATSVNPINVNIEAVPIKANLQNLSEPLSVGRGDEEICPS